MGSCTALEDIRDLLEESGYLERTSFLDLIVRNNIRDMSTPEALARTTKCYDWGSKTIFYCWNAIILFTALLFPRLLGVYLHATKEAKFRRPIQELATRLVWDKYFGKGGRRRGQMAQPESKTFKDIQQNLQLFQKQKGQEVPLSHRGKWYILRDILQPSRPYAVGIQKLASRSLAKLVDLVESSEDNAEDEDDVDAEVDDAARETDFELEKKISKARDQVDDAEQDTEFFYEELHSTFGEYQHARKGPQPAHASTIAQAKEAMDFARTQFDDATKKLREAEESLEGLYEERRQYRVKLKSERDKGKRPSVIMQAIIQVVENEERAWTFNQWLRGVWSVLWNEHGFLSKSHTPSAVASLSEKEYGNRLSAQVWRKDGGDGPSKQMTSWEEQATEYATQVVARWEKLAFIGWILSWIALVVYIAMLIAWPGANDIMATLEESVFDTIVASPGCPRLSDIVANRIVAFGGECVETETIRSFLEVLETAASIEEQIADLDSALHSFVEDGGKQNFMLRFMVQTKYCAPPSRSDQLFANINVMRAILLPSIVLPTLIFFIYVPTKHRNFFPKAFKVAIYKTYRTIKRAMVITIEGTLHIGALWLWRIAKTVGTLLAKALIYIVIGIPLAILGCALALGFVALGVAVLLVAGASAIAIGIPLGVIFFIAKGVQRLVQKLAQGLRALHNIVVSHLPSRCELCALEFHRYRRWYRCPDHYCRAHRFRADTKISQCPECNGQRLCN
ncbi:Hypothetical Protein FCC1311_112712 [Hondaea fermentalgiana]|uniref:Uncharacterized protein n=1 Tax=Hondaea fermentalgiana TaxID=2315210 RepID=A0A2R5GZ02_9STRA|nr:Hypothetical Protein FCC1311_112712 [Hondaea fermentalgiana]|eukprot:GBG35048.1 Hypothetical Protein FCC1311_112712 [Hondaea fermentalgiana]